MKVENGHICEDGLKVKICGGSVRLHTASLRRKFRNASGYVEVREARTMRGPCHVDGRLQQSKILELLYTPDVIQEKKLWSGQRICIWVGDCCQPRVQQ